MNKNVAVIILAAGKSTRMKSDIPKVLHQICGRPMLGYVLDLISELKIDKRVIVLGYGQSQVRKILTPGINIVIQKRLLGTADAVKEALKELRSFKGTVLVLYADNPLLKKATIARLLKYHAENKLDVTLLTADLNKPFGYGRILRDKYSNIYGIAEDKDADDFQKEIKEINTGIICFNKDKLALALKMVRPSNRKKEYYLTDTIGILYRKGSLVDGIKIADMDEALGINSRSDLARANKIMQSRINEEIMRKGVTILDPDSTFISFGAKIGQDTTIYPFTVIESNVRIGKHCRIGPFARIRPGTVLDDAVSIGNFGEIVRTRVNSGTKAKHVCYIADSRIGRHVNIGAGTITANYDGKKKSTTIINDQAFIGSDTILVAPVRIGKGAKTGAGSVVTKNKNVRAGATVVGVPAKPFKNV